MRTIHYHRTPLPFTDELNLHESLAMNAVTRGRLTLRGVADPYDRLTVRPAAATLGRETLPATVVSPRA